MNPSRGETADPSAVGAADVDADHADSRLVARSCEVPDVSVREFLAERAPPRHQWAAPDGLELVGVGSALTLTASGPDRFDDVASAADRALEDVDRDGPAATRPRLLGGFAFMDDHEPSPPWAGFPAAAFTLPRLQLTRPADADATWLTARAYGPDVDPGAVESALEEARASVASLPAMSPSGPKPGVAASRYVVDEAEWTAQVERAVRRIRAGDLRKVVLSTPLAVELVERLDVADALERLRRTYPDCYRFLVQPTADAAFFGPPPERLVRLTGRRVETEALAGSVERGDTPEADAELARSLVASEKLQHEQRLVVDAICEQLSAVGEVSEGEQGVRKLTNIQHLQTPIAADLDGDRHVLDIVAALHPTPAVGGLPPDAAWEAIRETETFDRGWYAAPVGWFDADGDGEFAVALRSCVASGDRATLFAGNGIVADSDPDAEWAELGHKFRPVLDELHRERTQEP
jgi:menaquinone-specific isochorismate synthase